MSPFTFFLYISLLLVGIHAAEEPHFLPVVKQTANSKFRKLRKTPAKPDDKLEIMGVGSVVRQGDAGKPVCDEFFHTYGQVRRTTLYVQEALKPAEASYKRCKACLFCFNCDGPRNDALVSAMTKCRSKFGFSRCAMAVYLLGREDNITFSCRFYLKESRIGNCYALEYLALNGLKGGENKDKLVFNREIGKVGNSPFQCRAGNRANPPDLKGQHVCRSKFKMTVQQMEAVASCALPAYNKALTDYTYCTISAFDQFSSTQCYNHFVHRSDLAYVNCIDPHGVEAVAVASQVVGRNALMCPVMRRDSYVGRCKAPDYINLVQLGLVDLTVTTYAKVLLSGACNYKK